MEASQSSNQVLAVQIGGCLGQGTASVLASHAICRLESRKLKPSVEFNGHSLSEPTSLYRRPSDLVKSLKQSHQPGNKTRGYLIFKLWRHLDDRGSRTGYWIDYMLILHFPLQVCFVVDNKRVEACDLTQQTFCRLARRSHQIRDTKKIRCWLYTTLRREFCSRYLAQTSHLAMEFRHEIHDIPSFTDEDARVVCS
jgi:Sigma-70 region 2